MRIGLTGTHGVGKTTILDLLELGDDYVKIPELARSNIDFFGKPPQDMTDFEAGFFETMILLEQITYETSYDFFVSDRTVVDLLAYAEISASKEVCDKLKTIVTNYLSKKRYDIVFYFPIEFPLVKDGIRYEGDELQHKIDARVVELFEEFGIKLVKLSGSPDKRLSTIKETLRNLFLI